jgi:ABC-type Fe3+/spermidine/putrescine transport system ATPase subunit
VILAKNVKYTAGEFNLDVECLEVKDGELHVLLGSTGSGKTLMLEYIAGLLPKAQGSISINGLLADGLPPEKRRTSYVTQDLSLFPTMTVKENVEFSLRFRGAGDHWLLAELIEVTEIEPLLDRYPETLSGGEKQRVAIVRALASRPAAILLDEPFSALHPSLRLSMWRMLKDLHERLQLSILLVSHDVEEALALGDVISYIDKGVILQTSRRKEVYYHPRTLELAQFFGFRNIFRARVETVADESIFLCDEGMGTIEVAVTHRLRDVKPGDSVWWGIHAEEITVVRPEKVHVPRSNLFTGAVVNQVDVGRSRMAIIELDSRVSGTRPVLELSLPEHAARRLKVAEGHYVHLQLKPERLFVIRD